MWGNRATSRRTNRRNSLNTAEILRLSAGGARKWRDKIFLLRMVVILLIVCAGVVSAGVLTWQGTRSIGQYLFFQNNLFNLRAIKINCDGEVVTSKHIFEYLELGACSNLFAFNMAGRRAELLQKVPRIKSAEFTRRLPGELIVEVHERQPLARLDMGSYYLTIDREGYVLGTSAGPRILPVICGHKLSGLRPGVQLDDRKIFRALDVLKVCDTTPAGNYVRIKTLNVDKPEYLELALAEGERAKLAWTDMDQQTAAAGESLNQKLLRLAESLKSAAARGKKIESIDMTVENNFPAQEY